MSDSWIDKSELDNLIFSFFSGRGDDMPRRMSPHDIFDDIPPMARAQPQGSPHLQPGAQVQQPLPPHESPLQVLVNRSNRGSTAPATSANFPSPFSLDEDDDFDEIESQISHLAEETAKAMRVLQEVRARADRNGLIASEARPEAPVVKEEIPPEIDGFGDEIELVLPPLDRIPLDVEIDPDLSLKGRLQALSDILKSYVGMEEMIVVDRDGFTLFATKERQTVEKSVGQFVQSIRKVYESESDPRSHTSSQLAIENGKWLCIIPTDGDIDGKFLMKALLPTPLDRPEIYVLVELLNEVLRPETI